MRDYKFNPDTDVAVSLDTRTLLDVKHPKQSQQIAEALLEVCGVFQMWDDPRKMKRIWYVKTMPEDVPQAGVFWIKEEVMVFDYKPWE